MQELSAENSDRKSTFVRRKYVHSATAKAKLPRTAMATFEVER